MVESRYFFNPEASALEYYFEAPADYNQATYGAKGFCLEGISRCKFSYSDGQVWRNYWDEELGRFPRAIKVTFNFKDDAEAREFILNTVVTP